MISRNATYLFAGRIVVLLSGLVFMLVVPRTLGPEGMGYYSYWFSLFSLFAVVLDFGGTLTIRRFVPQMVKEGRESVASLLSQAVAVRVLFFVVLVVLGPFFFRGNAGVFLLIACGALLLTVENFMISFLFGLKEMGKYAGAPPANALMRLLLLLVCYRLYGKPGIIAAIALFCVPYLVWLFPAFVRRIRGHRGVGRRVHYRPVFLYGVRLFAGLMLYSFIIRLCVPLAEQFTPDMEQIGYLGFALLVTVQTIQKIPDSFTHSLFPRLVEINAVARENRTKEEHRELRRLYTEAWRYINMVLFPLLAGIAALIEPVIRVVVGVEYLPSIPLVYLSMPAVVLMNWFTLNLIFMQSEDKIGRLSILIAVSFLTFVAAAIPGVMTWGIMAVPPALGLAMGLLWVLSYVSVSASMSGARFPDGWWKPLAACIVMCSVCVVLPRESAGFLLAELVAAVLVYVGCMFLMRGIRTSDLSRIRAVFLQGKPLDKVRGQS